MLNEIAIGAGLTPNEKMMLSEKLNEILPIFGLMENVGDLVIDITNDICAIIDEATCKACDLLNVVPVKPEDIASTIEIPLNFTIEVVDFFVITLDMIRSIEIADIFPFDFLPDLNLNVNDLPFVDNKQVNIQFPNLCSTVTCN